MIPLIDSVGIVLVDIALEMLGYVRRARGAVAGDFGVCFGFSGAYTDAKYTKNVVDLSRQTGVAGYTIPFDSYPDAPKVSGSLYADVTLPVSEKIGRVHFRANSSSQTSNYFSNNNDSITPGTRMKGYMTVTLRVGIEDIAGSRFSASVYAKNVFNRLHYQAGYVKGNSGGFNTVIVGEPRTVAGELTFKF